MTRNNKTEPMKIVLLGDSGTGKTSLLSQFTRNKFDSKCKPTSGVHWQTKDVSVDNATINVEMWDLGGREKQSSLPKPLLSDAAGILLVYDISKVATFNNIAGWLDEILPMAKSETVVKLVGNKSDLKGRRAVSMETAGHFAADHGMFCVEASALDGSNVKVIFEWMIKEIGTASKCPNDRLGSLFSTCLFISNCMKEQLSPESSSDNPTRPFHIVLIDIEEATVGRISCVEKPLIVDDDGTQEDLKYVAISYRWGELHEKLIDTGVGYVASVTSFSLGDFSGLCNVIRLEKDLRHMKYVWVDAICVDQTNPSRRKATIYQMNNIYKRANYILAVPDLHAAHLRSTMTEHQNIMRGTTLYNKHIYHLIHGNADQLEALENQWLDGLEVPLATRQWLTSYTDHFTEGLMKPRWHHYFYHPEDCLDHIYEVSEATSREAITHRPLNDVHQCTEEEECVHHCNDVNCPLYFFDGHLPQWKKDLLRADKFPCYSQWKDRVQKRSTSIRRSMAFLANLIVDWSTRVWVISEYSIAKEQNNFKYWFIQLGNVYLGLNNVPSFFTIDFKNKAAAAARPIRITSQTAMTPPFAPLPSDPVYITFTETVDQQLKNQTFLEMILKSKASKPEDRFYAVFPLFKHYKAKVENKTTVRGWKIDTMLSVKLKLFEVMATLDQLNLLFLTTHSLPFPLAKMILPTFATTSLSWADDVPLEYINLAPQVDPATRCNFDLIDPSTMVLMTETNENTDDLDDDGRRRQRYFLQLKPLEYYVEINESSSSHDLAEKTTICNHLQISASVDTMDVVCIPSFGATAMKTVDIDWRRYCIFLVGCFEKNKWVLSSATINDPTNESVWKHQYIEAHPFRAFHIY